MFCVWYKLVLWFFEHGCIWLICFGAKLFIEVDKNYFDFALLCAKCRWNLKLVHCSGEEAENVKRLQTGRPTDDRWSESFISGELLIKLYKYLLHVSANQNDQSNVLKFDNNFAAIFVTNRSNLVDLTSLIQVSHLYEVIIDRILQ